MFAPSTIWRFLDRHSMTLKKTAHASEQDRPDVLARRRAWFKAQPDLDPERLVFIDETGASTKMARLRGRAKRGMRCRSPIPHGHVWRPRRMQEESSVQAAARDRVLPCVRPHFAACSRPRARMGVRGSGPHHWNALEALPMRLVLLIPPRPTLRHTCPSTFSRPPDGLASVAALRRRRTELGRFHPSSSVPRRCAPFCWPAPRSPALAVYAPASYGAKSRMALLFVWPIGPRRWMR